LEYLDRGYADFEGKLNGVGASIRRVGPSGVLSAAA
jgi:UDP-N-acetylglucosamine 1-carboxyvinyltransferase